MILFDLDGTLTDPVAGITRSVQYALDRFGIKEDTEKLVPFIGPPLQKSFQLFYSLDEKQAWQAVEYYREYYAERGIYENAVFPGIPELLKRLREDGRCIALATSKPTFFAEKVLRHFNLKSSFSQIAGSNMDGTRTGKAEIIEHVLAQHPSFSKKETIMIGDRMHDIAGARAHAIDSAAVTYGYGSLEELRKANPTYLIHSVGELFPFLVPGKHP